MKTSIQSTRREFVGGAAAFLAALGWKNCVHAAPAGATLAPWKPGNLDLHFIYTGCGENMFYRLPDGTAILNDVGDMYRPKDLAEIPLLPSADRLGGDWVARYIARVYPEKTIDYALFSHFHTDHIGHADFDKPDTPNAANRYRVNAQGEKINGFRCVTERFRIARCYDPQYPKRGSYGTGDSSQKLLAPWMERERKNGLLVEPFRVGALNQIRLQRDPAAYADCFAIRNLCANGVLWDGHESAVDLAAEQAVMDTNAPGWIGQNNLSMGLHMRYGKFTYLTLADMHAYTQYRLDGSPVVWDEMLARFVGPVSVCKMNHHGCAPDMSRGFLEAARAGTYVGCMWCPRQVHPKTLARILDAAKATGGPRPLILPQLFTQLQRDWFTAEGIPIPNPSGAHVVVRVEPGGDAYRVYLLDARDEEMRILATFDKKS